ncbi:hypothetical protein ABZX40_38600 [Streptomyces sp. NPDC004610]|uniref:hypothetical protein n=1 Tax=unclassified Streptomyces TaxID=2593676 RepID=UPI0033BCAFAC
MSAASAPSHAERAGRRVEAALDRLTATGDPAATAAAEELVGSLMEFYGAGLARVLDLLSPTGRTGDVLGDRLDNLLGDDLVASLLLLHDLHPEDLPTRIRRALDRVDGTGYDILDHDESTGTLRLRAAPATATGCGCSSGAPDAARAAERAAARAAEEALSCFAPEVTAVEVSSEPRRAEPALLQIGVRPGTGA